MDNRETVMHCGNYGQQTGEGWTQLGYSLEVPAKTILPIDSSNDEFPVGKTKITGKARKIRVSTQQNSGYHQKN